jgi:hypothetical protein
MSHNAYNLADVEGVIFGAFVLHFHSLVGVEVDARCEPWLRKCHEFNLFAVVITPFDKSLEILMC